MPDYKKTGNNKPNTKGFHKKPSAVKPKSKNQSLSPAIIIGFILSIILICGLLVFIFTRKPKVTQPPKQQKPQVSKTIQIKAKGKSDKLKVETYTETEEKPTYKKNNTSVTPPKNVSHRTLNSSGTQKLPVPPNKFVSPAREWQPINPGLREATNRFKNLVYGGKPVTIQNLNLLENQTYYSAYDERRKNPIWVAYRLDAHQVQNKEPNRLQRPSKFVTDFRTKSKVDQRVYAKTGYDRGHMCPNSAIATRYGKKAQLETFFMSNITPQKPELNRKVWERLERLEDAYANKFGGIWIITGPIFDQHVELLNHQIEIPDAFFKILIDEDKGKVRVLPFIIPQNVTGKEILNEYLTSVDEIERQTNLDFFSPMDDEFEKKLESYIPGKTLWN